MYTHKKAYLLTKIKELRFLIIKLKNKISDIKPKVANEDNQQNCLATRRNERRQGVVLNSRVSSLGSRMTS